MKKLKSAIITGVITFIAGCLFPHNSQAQLINDKFDKLLISENFDSINPHWTTMANADNLFIVQDGEYILQRKAPAAPYAIIANFEDNYSNFRAVTAIKLDNTLSETGFAGFLFMMQPEGQGGFLVELNKNKEYRLRQIVNGSYKYITGSMKNGGWTRSSFLNETGLTNMVEIRNMGRNYDLYLNNNFVQSFTEASYRSGKMGIIIGPATRSKIDFLYVFTVTTDEDLAKNIPEPISSVSPNSGESDVIEMSESIIRLKTQVNKLNDENEDLRLTISAMKSGDQEKDVTIKNSEKQVKILQDQLSKKEQTVDSLVKKNTELMKFKEMAGGNENGDLIISLSKNLKSEKEKNILLANELKELKEKYGESTAPVKNSGKSTKTDAGNSQKKDTTNFKLPVEN